MKALGPNQKMPDPSRGRRSKDHQMEKTKKNILIVDDYSTNLKMLRAVLETDGFNVFEANDGVEALAVLEQKKVDAMITDILMPRMDGYRLCLEVRKREDHKALPIIIYTSTYTSPGDEKCALNSGADEYIQKPAPAQRILDALQELLKASPIPKAKPPSVPEELEVMREYSEVLIRKLEEKNKDLEQAQQEIAKANQDLERRVSERTAQLEEAKSELEAFNRLIAHDLRNPLSVILGFARLLENICKNKLAKEEIQYVQKITHSAGRMEGLIGDLLRFSEVGHTEIHRSKIDLSVMAGKILNKLQQSSPDRTVQIAIEPGVVADADEPLLQIVLENLFLNAWKFTSRNENARIEFGEHQRGAESVYFVRDNGIGLDMAHAEKLFSVFQRLHSSADFPGSGIGLATVRRIIHRHGGRVGVDSTPGRGSTFYFTLSTEQDLK